MPLLLKRVVVQGVARICRRRRHSVALLAVLAAGHCFAETAPTKCPPHSISRADLLKLKQEEFQIANTERIQSLTLELLPCLSDPDPVLRDTIAFDALATWMRGKKVSHSTAIAVLDTELARLTAPDPRGFAKPFAALVLAEVTRMDRIEPFLSADQRIRLSASAVVYLRSISDYRGFDTKEGWRHGVAHSADLLLQLALNPNIAKEALDANLTAIATQVAPGNGHSYIYGEPGRLATAVFWTAQRNLHSTEEWTTWTEQIAKPAPFQNWGEAFRSPSGLARRHSTLSFLQSLYVLVAENGNAETRQRLLPAVKKALQAVG